MEVRIVSAAIPTISNMTTIHDFTINVSKIRVGYFFVLGQIVVEHITTNCQVTIVKVIVSGPAL